ncbi:Thymidine kinase [Carpediemonas membranifera]|uniref:Thymidine kinase n=1 Tax=Carpediemonas membranifera TaxID=201153 RepID=A0A8J6B4J3_9EUKA|nr:Thymidine kinase [Carpediemonas membranifera]|eukprot:KAG9394174.1 Thymidine kinase [Carpediemonas membranifera]
MDFGGSITLVFGPMFSGKTTELMRLCDRQQLAGRKVLVIKYSKDTRYTANDEISTHVGHTLSAIPTDKLFSVSDAALDAEVIGIDEGQFFPDIVQFADDMANAGKHVIVAALDGTFRRDPFPSRVIDLLPRAEHVTKLSAVCHICGRNAPFSRRITADTDVEVIGGADMYVAVCRRCFHADVAESFKVDPKSRSPVRNMTVPEPPRSW